MILKSRRMFLKAGFLSSVVFITVDSELFGAVTVMQTISLVQEDLFPQSVGVPTKKEINATAYLALILQHPRVTNQDKEYIKNGVKWLNEEAVSKYKKVYTKLTPTQRQAVLKDISLQRWGEVWISDILKYIFEAMLGDPIYGINKNESGWKWLKHSAGLPRPKEAYL